MKDTVTHSYRWFVCTVKWFRYTPWRRFGWEEAQLLLFLNLSTRRGWAVSIGTFCTVTNTCFYFNTKNECYSNTDLREQKAFRNENKVWP
jgi:hypothetical protein